MLILLNTVLGMPHCLLMIDLLTSYVLTERGVLSFEVLTDVLGADVFFLDIVETELPFIIEFPELVLVLLLEAAKVGGVLLL